MTSMYILKTINNNKSRLIIVLILQIIFLNAIERKARVKASLDELKMIKMEKFLPMLLKFFITVHIFTVEIGSIFETLLANNSGKTRTLNIALGFEILKNIIIMPASNHVKFCQPLYNSIYNLICTFLFIISISNRVSSLILSAGQRMPPRVIPTNADPFLTASPEQRISIMDLPQVERWASQHGLQEHHLKKLYRVIFESRNCMEDLTDCLIQAEFPKKYAANLAEHFVFGKCQLIESQKSEGGFKLVIQLTSGKLIETVIIRHERDFQKRRRYTVCVSSQVGCSKGCSFCATGTMGLEAQLSSSEILEQVWIARHFVLVEEQKNYCNDEPLETNGKHINILRNVVFMGMGEPLDNYDAVYEACRGLTHQCLFGLKGKHVTISTVGASPKLIRQLADEAPQVSLALSLHGPTQSLRERLIPSARRSSLEELGSALDYHSIQTGKGAMIEYLMIHGVNDDEESSAALASFCRERCHLGDAKVKSFVNLIPYNPTTAGEQFGYRTPPDDRIYSFQRHLQEQGIQVLIRWTSATGRDTNGACGQLALSRK
jgi:adenine C2-methylase RlmN of 23S rRNA A2503 and tRNA A37